MLLSISFSLCDIFLWRFSYGVWVFSIIHTYTHTAQPKANATLPFLILFSIITTVSQKQYEQFYYYYKCLCCWLFFFLSDDVAWFVRSLCRFFCLIILLLLWLRWCVVLYFCTFRMFWLFVKKIFSCQCCYWKRMDCMLGL